MTMLKQSLTVVFICGLYSSALYAVHDVIYSDQDKVEASDEALTEHSGPTPLYSREDVRYQLLQKVTYGNASFNDVLKALSDIDDVGYLTSVLHALYTMRWHRGVIKILDDLWLQNTNNHPGLAWESLNKIPTRIAIASTLTRIRVFKNQEYKIYIREHKYDEHEFHRAQVVIALGLNADPVDIPYIKEMADAENIYVAQSATTSLAIMGSPQARDVLYELAKKYSGTDRGRLIREVILQAYPKE
jgi:hypothetical protein